MNLFNEVEAARKLGVSRATLIRERLVGRIKPIRMGQRIIRYNDEILAEYIQECRKVPGNAGEPDSNAVRHKTSRTHLLDPLLAHRVAQQTFRRPKPIDRKP